MSTQTLISVEEYLSTSYKPDVDYVDGHIEERHLGEKSHGKMINRLWLLLRDLPGVFPFTETRTQVMPNRYRVPDVCAYLDGEPDEERFTVPPFLCIEVLSPEDRMLRALRVAADYFAMGVPNVWIIDPLDGIAYVCGAGGVLLVASDSICTADGRIQIPLDAVFGK